MTRNEAIAELVRIWNGPHLDLILKAGLAEAIETLKEKNQSDSLFRDDAENCKESESKLDLISRQDAIDAVIRECEPICDAYDNVVTEINSLPSAEMHDKRTETHSVCSDLIRRSDAMGAVQDHFNADGFKGYDDGQKMLDRLKALPSADITETETCQRCQDLTDTILNRQGDEIKRLKAEARQTGEWIFNTSTSNGKSWNVCSECGESMFHPANFCPNCGARMKGAEHETD